MLPNKKNILNIIVLEASTVKRLTVKPTGLGFVNINIINNYFVC